MYWMVRSQITSAATLLKPRDATRKASGGGKNKARSATPSPAPDSVAQCRGATAPNSTTPARRRAIGGDPGRLEERSRDHLKSLRWKIPMASRSSIRM